MAYQYKRSPLLKEEAERIWNACETMHEKLVIWTLLETGLRISELCSLTPQNIDWQGHTLRITGKGGPYGKMSRQRVVPMSGRVRALLEPYFAINNKWFIGPRGANKMIKRVANRARISSPISPHVLRHTFAVLCMEKGISIASLQKILGHDHLSTTQIYLNIKDVDLVNDFKKKWD